MKRILPLLLCLLSLNLIAQTNIQLNILHVLGDEAFSFETVAQNNLGHDFQLSRLQYYISEIAISHDNGQKTTIDDLWVLVDAIEPTNIDLGDHNINFINNITFYVGVDFDHNHLDPASFPMDHPLAPKFPSMHWGWAFGYRFLAMEGVSGVGLGQPLELHSLGDDNYFKTEVEVDANIGGDQFDLNLIADYSRILENLDVNAGILLHGSHGEAPQSLQNMSDYVFTLGEIITNTPELENIKTFEVFPNPSNIGQASIQLEVEDWKNYQIQITDGLGRVVQRILPQQSIIPVEIGQAGIYFVQLMESGETILSKKLIVK